MSLSIIVYIMELALKMDSGMMKMEHMIAATKYQIFLFRSKSSQFSAAKKIVDIIKRFSKPFGCSHEECGSRRG